MVLPIRRRAQYDHGQDGERKTHLSSIGGWGCATNLRRYPYRLNLLLAGMLEIEEQRKSGGTEGLQQDTESDTKQGRNSVLYLCREDERSETSPNLVVGSWSNRQSEPRILWKRGRLQRVEGSRTVDSQEMVRFG